MGGNLNLKTYLLDLDEQWRVICFYKCEFNAQDWSKKAVFSFF